MVFFKVENNVSGSLMGEGLYGEYARHLYLIKKKK